MTDNTMREGKLWAFLHDSIHEAYKKLSTTGTSCEYHALLDSIAAKVADDVDARFLQAAQSVPEGWRFDRCSDGSINVIKDGHGGANVEQNAKQARCIPEEVLWMLANDLLSVAPEGMK